LLAAAEVEGALRALGFPGEGLANASMDGPVLRIPAELEGDPGAKLKEFAVSSAARLGFCHGVGIPLSDPWDGDEMPDGHFLVSSAENFTMLLDDVDVPDDSPPNKIRTFSTAGKRLTAEHAGPSPSHVGKQLAGMILQNDDSLKVDLDAAQFQLRCLRSARLHLYARLAEVDRGGQEARVATRRPFFRPTSLHPRLARAMVNLAAVPPGGTIRDPFCGTGGVLIEAALMGYRVEGSDIDPEMVRGALENLAASGIEGAHITLDDIRKRGPSAAGEAEGWVTEPPFGRASGHSLEELRALYGALLDRAAEVLPAGGRLVNTFPGEEHIPRAPVGLVLDQVFSLRVHGSLTRNLCVFCRGKEQRN
jgi:tRNA (guanine10-N2)-dimethyltransferase